MADINLTQEDADALLAMEKAQATGRAELSATSWRLREALGFKERVMLHTIAVILFVRNHRHRAR